ncbi:helix-turn-helix domain-containing protein [Streptomyces sp. NPDC002564]|uniref:helix-turn-helix domain-containing protein n=1 Tax=Streptomyces sp. NPDC002564 TaxID=3364649 RepID=UPI0036B7AC0E
MAPRDLRRLAARVRAHRQELYPSRLAAATAAGISKDTWQRVEEGEPVRGTTYAKVDSALQWATGSSVAVTEGGEPVLVDDAGGARVSMSGKGPLDADVLRQAAFDAARATLPTASIGDLDAFTDELVEVLRRSGDVAE